MFRGREERWEGMKGRSNNVSKDHTTPKEESNAMRGDKTWKKSSKYHVYKIM